VSLSARASAIAAAARESLPARREKNRAEMPETAAIVDDLRKAFGTAAIKWARFTESGRTVEWGRR
jgi:hypothetical protein